MTKKIFATSGIGLETATALAALGHHLLVHGRSAGKVEALERTLRSVPGAGAVEGYVADLSRLDAVEALAAAVAGNHETLDVLVNNAGVFKTPEPIAPGGGDVRFVVNTFAPYVLAQRLNPLMDKEGRVINLSSAAQNPVDLEALAGRVKLADFEAYAQSKLALTMWSCHLGRTFGDQQPVFVAVNPGSMLGTNMVKQGFGVSGKDVRIGSKILIRAALADEFAGARGAYFDNDAKRFAEPHPDALDPSKCEAIVRLVGETSVSRASWA